MTASPETPRFLVLTPAADGADGVSELSRQVIRALVADSQVVEVWTLAGGAPADPIASRATFRSARGRRSRLVGWMLRRACVPLPNTTVIVMHVHLAPLAAVLSLRRARAIMFLVGVEVWRRLRLREKIAVQRADRLIAISQHTVRRFREANPTLAVRTIEVCHPGVSARAASPAPPPIATFALIVGRMARDERYKGHDALIDVWPDVRARVPAAVLVVVGDGDDRDRLERRAAGTVAAEAIRFVGRVDSDALAGIYGATSFFVMPSLSEGFGLVYLEAMRMGKPCIALHGAADEIVEDGVSGILLDAGNTAALADAVVRLFSDAPLCARMGAAARARVERDFTEAQFARRLRSALGLTGAAPRLRVPAAASVAGVR